MMLRMQKKKKKKKGFILKNLVFTGSF